MIHSISWASFLTSLGFIKHSSNASSTSPRQNVVLYVPTQTMATPATVALDHSKKLQRSPLNLGGAQVMCCFASILSI